MADSRYTHRMQLTHIRLSLSFFWMILVSLAGIAAGVSTVLGWTVLAGLALTPPLVTYHLWNPPRQTMSQSIQEARR
jgi:hypothetical protein